ncbi:NAD(P)/FAD-dependent oxidoreductase [Thalassoglobus sp.]|uniref:NAD(P)/FAD-dependent oxidoreductase n=1 Tax=Thalassoglobus sp. TaxID=2795869 RepID=UPI003AA8EAE8
MAQKHQVVVIGGGFGGLETARRLRRVDVAVTLIDRRNFHLFQPLLYQVATGGLSPANIATPLRSILRKQKNCQILMGEVVGFNAKQKQVVLRDKVLQYDTLVLAAGAGPSYFGNDSWETYAPPLKTIEDATSIRGRIYTSFELAENETDPERRKELLTFIVIGGGPTGVELAGALAEISHHTLVHDFRHINPKEARIILVEAGGAILSTYPSKLTESAARKVQELGVEIRLHTMVTGIEKDRIELKTPSGIEHIATHTVMWAAGVKPNPLSQVLASEIGIDCHKSGRIPVNSALNIEGHPDLFVIGDIAHCEDHDGKPLPGVAPVAIQQGRYVAKTIQARLRGDLKPEPFRYQNRGSMATIGRKAAVAEIGKFTFSGFFAWLLWLVIHLMQIVQFQNRLLVLFQWSYSYFTYNRSARLITQPTSELDQEFNQDLAPDSKQS